MKQQLKKFDLVRTDKIAIGIVLSDTIQIPYFQDGLASEFSKVPLDIQNPKEWEDTFSARIVFDLTKNEHVILNENHEHYLLDSSDSNDGYIFFDNATANLRVLKGLLVLAAKCYGEERFLTE